MKLSKLTKGSPFACNIIGVVVDRPKINYHLLKVPIGINLLLRNVGSRHRLPFTDLQQTRTDYAKMRQTLKVGGPWPSRHLGQMWHLLSELQNKGLL